MLTKFISVLLLLLSSLHPAQVESKGKERQAMLDAELAELATELGKGEKDSIQGKLYVFARKHAPLGLKPAVLLSTDKKICVAIGATGTVRSPNGGDMRFTPVASQYDVAIGGRGFDSETDDGGNGGTVTLKAKSQGKCILLGGEGGKPADPRRGMTPKKPGMGGNVWYGENLNPDDWAIAGQGGFPGGEGGISGPKPPKAVRG